MRIGNTVHVVVCTNPAPRIAPVQPLADLISRCPRGFLDVAPQQERPDILGTERALPPDGQLGVVPTYRRYYQHSVGLVAGRSEVHEVEVQYEEQTRAHCARLLLVRLYTIRSLGHRSPHLPDGDRRSDT